MESINKETVFVFVKLLRPGIKVAKAVVDENGFLLVGEGTILTDKMIAIIKMSNLTKIEVINEKIFSWQLFKSQKEKLETLNKKFSGIKDKNMLILKQAIKDKILKEIKDENG